MSESETEEERIAREQRERDEAETKRLLEEYRQKLAEEAERRRREGG
jgi:hypothetical protein